MQDAVGRKYLKKGIKKAPYIGINEVLLLGIVG
jgi:hypothetical protein